MTTKPEIGTIVYWPQTQHRAVVVEHTERGFKYKGEPRPFIARWGMSFTGEGEVYTDIPEWDYKVENKMIQFE